MHIPFRNIHVTYETHHVFSERASVEIFAFVRSKTPISFNVYELILTNFVCMFVANFVTKCTYILCSFTTNQWRTVGQRIGGHRVEK